VRNISDNNWLVMITSYVISDDYYESD
jgi:hypothetical protein